MAWSCPDSGASIFRFARKGWRRFGIVLLAAVLLSPVAGCHQQQEPETEATAAKPAAPAVATVDVAALRTQYEACRQQANGDAGAIAACADRAVAAWPTVSKGALARFADAALTIAGGDTLAARAQVADALANLAFERAELAVGAPLPTAPERPAPDRLRASWDPLAPCGPSASAACRAGEERLLRRFAARLGNGAAPARGEEGAPALGGYVPPTCGEVRAAAPADALATFERDFPAALKDERLVEKVSLDDARLRAVSAYLACLAARTDYGPDVAESSLWFYGSRRQGARALAQLDALARTKGQDAAAAREFAGQIRDYLAPDEPGQ